MERVKNDRGIKYCTYEGWACPPFHQPRNPRLSGGRYVSMFIDKKEPTGRVLQSGEEGPDDVLSSARKSPRAIFWPLDFGGAAKDGQPNNDHCEKPCTDIRRAHRIEAETRREVSVLTHDCENSE